MLWTAVGVDFAAGACFVSGVGDFGCSETTFAVGDWLGIASAGFDAADQLRAYASHEPVDRSALLWDKAAVGSLGLTRVFGNLISGANWSEREAMRNSALLKATLSPLDTVASCRAFEIGR
ncbi:hypothetical protein EFY87_15700 [Flexivirga caeni]|uniref:Uncharacterized protein n=1 Tax=Flexivirga caeni TaxID=2294115 RepID=A0A3M9M2U1_9MICO|nr:hypothetical protein EFY87_15700 [Flexivirga caeni]